MTVQDAPIISIGCQFVHLLKLQVLASCLVVVNHVVSASVAEYLSQIVPTTHSVPVAIVHLATRYRGTRLGFLGFGFQIVVALFDAVKDLAGLFLLTNKHAHKLDPLSLS